MKREIHEFDIKRLTKDEYQVLEEWCSAAGISNSIHNLNLIDLIELNMNHPEFAMEAEDWGIEKPRLLVQYHKGDVYTGWVETELFDSLWEMTLNMIKKKLK